MSTTMTWMEPISGVGAPIHRPALEAPELYLSGALAAVPEATERHGYALHYGNARAPLVRVVPDDIYPNMWRMIWPDGQVSDMTNLSRAKDAAAEICDRGPPRRDRRRFHWKIDRSFLRHGGAKVFDRVPEHIADHASTEEEAA
jgi:hypothetical protein